MSRDAKRRRNALLRSLEINQIYLQILTQGFFADYRSYSDLKNSKWRIQNGGKVNLINFYKPLPPH